MNWLKLAKEVIVAFVIAGVVLLLIGLMSDESSPPLDIRAGFWS